MERLVTDVVGIGSFKYGKSTSNQVGEYLHFTTHEFIWYKSTSKRKKTFSQLHKISSLRPIHIHVLAYLSKPYNTGSLVML